MMSLEAVHYYKIRKEVGSKTRKMETWQQGRKMSKSTRFQRIVCRVNL